MLVFLPHDNHIGISQKIGSPELREQVARRLAASKAPASWISMVQSAIQLDEADQRRSFGEALPPGLKWLGND